MLVSCPECGKEVLEGSDVCPHCGCPLDGVSSDEHSDDMRGLSSDNTFASVGKKKFLKYVVVFACVGATVLAVFCIWMFLICHHTEWREATCTEPKTCVRCGKTEGEPIGHVWKLDSYTVNFLSAEQTEKKCCSNCGATCEGETVKIESFVSDGKFLFDPEVFFDMYKAALKSQAPNLVLSRKEDPKLLGYMIYDDKGKGLGAVTFEFDGELVGPDDKLKGSNKYKISICIPSSGDDDYESVVYSVDALLALIDACDPSLDKEGAQAVAKEHSVADWKGGSKQFVENDIAYRVDIEKDSIWVYAAPV